MRFGELDIKLKRSNRKTVSIFVERDGSVTARIPEDLSNDDLNEVLVSKEYLIHKHLAEWKQLNAPKVDREYVNGQSFLYLGRNYRFRLIDGEAEGLLLRNGYFELSRSKKDNARKYFVNFYKSKLDEKLPPILKKYQGQLGVMPNDVRILELQHRWASCSNKGNLSFHWKCAMAPIDVLNYIVAHELVHLIHPNHTSAFWNDLDKIMPNYEKHVHWLKSNGAGMDL